ncbi:MAG: hypothetical protein QOI31_32 [Solirubrobacterales bacterium]|jgi:hypothetical protein|nr:hypothetical protein [Solirubrobacterales bacterium]
MFIAIATHHPHPDHVEDFLAHMHRVVDATAGAKGLLEFDCYRNEETGALLGVSKWESPEAFEEALPLIGSCSHLRQDEWTVAEDELQLLASVGQD